MITALLFFCHSRSTNPNFKPGELYIGTVILDYVLIMSLFKILGA